MAAKRTFLPTKLGFSEGTFQIIGTKEICSSQDREYLAANKTTRLKDFFK